MTIEQEPVDNPDVASAAARAPVGGEAERAALAYAQAGWHVFPCRPGRKEPATTHGHRDAKTEVSQIVAWWRNSPNCNVGVSTGPSGLVVLDIDPRNDGDESLRRLAEGLSVDLTTRTVRTGGGGEHRYFLAPRGVVISSRSNAFGDSYPGIDVKSGGGFVIAPPSIHPTGESYAWLDENAPLAELPLSITGTLASGGARGSHNSHEVVRGTPLAQFLQGLRDLGHEVNETSSGFKTRCPAHDDENASLSIGEGDKQELLIKCFADCTYSAIMGACGLADRDGFLKAADAGTQRTGTGGPTSREIVVRRLADVEPEEVEWAWQDRIPYGKVTLLAGDPGEGKSFASLAIAAALTRGSRLPGDARPGCEPVEVFLASYEDGAADTIRPRADKLRADPFAIHLLEGSRRDATGYLLPFSLDDVPWLLAKLEAYPQARVLIIDPVSALLGGVDAHRDAEVRSSLAILAEFAERRRIAVILIAHLNKNETTKALYRVGGSIGFVALARSVLLFGRDPDTGGRVVAPMKNNLAALAPAVEYSIEGGTFAWGTLSDVTAEKLCGSTSKAEARKNADDLETRIVRFVSEWPDPEPPTQAEIINAVGGNRNKIVAALSAACESHPPALLCLGRGVRGDQYRYQAASPAEDTDTERKAAVSGSDSVSVSVSSTLAGEPGELYHASTSLTHSAPAPADDAKTKDFGADRAMAPRSFRRARSRVIFPRYARRAVIPRTQAHCDTKMRGSIISL
jgi:hypothetical protein